jgi:hypothetical protein
MMILRYPRSQSPARDPTDPCPRFHILFLKDQLADKEDTNAAMFHQRLMITQVKKIQNVILACDLATPVCRLRSFRLAENKYNWY